MVGFRGCNNFTDIQNIKFVLEVGGGNERTKIRYLKEMHERFDKTLF